MTWWPASGWVGPVPRNLVTKLAIFFHCAVRHLQTVVQHNVIVGENLVSVKPTSNPLWPFFYFVTRFHKWSSPSRTQMERQWDMEVVRLQIVPSLSCQHLDSTVRRTLSFHHHMNSITGRTLSCHHMKSIIGRTFDMSFCPATTRTQPMGGR